METVLHHIALARKEFQRLVDQEAVILRRDFACAGRAAPLDLKQQARTSARLVIGIGAGPEQESALQRVDSATDRAGRCEGTEIFAFAVPRAAMFQDLRDWMVAGDEMKGKDLSSRSTTL